ncbi:RNA methyltransferase [Rothia terrae]|uniref:TrmH family RNA methyltransferase n=1 Tax=Rothia terrae TaxID=396015 RepID=UPI0014474CDC|nr:RNA methyltransferase [Rothia terrae]MDT0190016.1 RNA methyltransferase [Rothia terrae]NKZ34987.1 RNA methyltransferase [Rothia terrae]
MDFKERLCTPVMMENPHADRVKDIAKLATRSVRTKKKQFLVEGPQAVREALKAHLENPVLDAVYITEAAFERHDDIAELMEEVHGTPTPEAGRKVFMRMVTDEVLDAMAGAVTPQGVLAVSFMLDKTPADIWGADAINPHLVAVLARVQDPGNAGTIIRTADAAGADLVVLSKGTVDVYNPKVVRSTAGSIFHVPMISGVELEEFAEDAKAQGIGVLAADGYGKVNLNDLEDAAAAKRLGVELENKPKYDLSRKTMWLFGNEAQGLSPEEKRLANTRVAVPVHGSAESLNVSIAAAVCLYASARAIHEA